jgi:hypothetical protein
MQAFKMEEKLITSFFIRSRGIKLQRETTEKV